MLGRGNSNILIQYIGTVELIVEPMPQFNPIRTFKVKWFHIIQNREVPSRGCFGTIHKFTKQDSWIQKIFSL